MGFRSGFQLGQGIVEAKQRKELGQLGQQYLGGDESALQKIGGIDPQKAIELKSLKQAQSKKQQDDLQMASRFAKTVMDSEEEERPEVYRATMGIAKKYGIDVSELPEIYTPETAQHLQRVMDFAGGMKGDQKSYGKVPEGYVLDKETLKAKRFGGLPVEKEDRKIIKDVAGRQRYTDTGGLVFEGVKGKPKEYSATQAKTLGITKGGIEDIQTMKNLIKEVGGKITTGTAMGDAPFTFGLLGKFSKPKEKQLRTLRSDLSDKIGRLRSGGAINKDEEYRFKNLLPTLRDDPETIEFKLNKIEREFQTVQGGITGKKSQQKEQNKPQITREQAIQELKRRGKI